MEHATRHVVSVAIVATIFALSTTADEAVYDLTDLTVSPRTGQSKLPDISTAASRFDAASLDAANAQHFQDLVGHVPNFGWAGGTARPRYFQLRGIGESSQFAGEGPPNFSVGFLIDDMDFSGLAMHASLFDLESVEVLRGPQAAIYGSKALAGLVSLETRQPTTVDNALLELSWGTDGYRQLGVAAGGPLTRSNPEVLAIRLVFEHQGGNGYRHNVFLGRNDTNKRQSTMGRVKLLWRPTDDWRWDLSTLYGNADHGYDMWTPDNNGFRTYTDRPGEDSQETIGSSLRGTWFGPDAFRIVSISSWVNVDSRYSYDADWANNAFWAAAPYHWDAATEGYDYDFFEILRRTRQHVSRDIRLISEPGGEILWGRSAWHVGAYGSRLTESDDYDGFDTLMSDYEAVSGAGYGQLTTRLTPRLVLHSSLRVENRQTDYTDDKGVQFDDGETMWGGRLALESKLSRDVLVFGSMSRGFKGGGVNQDAALPADKRMYRAETLWSLETGLDGRFFEDALALGMRLFYMWRDDLQITTSFQGDPTDPTSFAYFTDNAAQGYNAGIELDVVQHITSFLRLFATIGLLDTAYENFESAGGINNINGRDQPLAPNVTYHTGVIVEQGGWFAQLDAEGRDDIYLSAEHDQKTDGYTLLNAKVGYGRKHWTLNLWGRNILDEKVVTRGYYFGLEPPAYEDTLYLAYGDPAQFGVSLSLVF